MGGLSRSGRPLLLWPSGSAQVQDSSRLIFGEGFIYLSATRLASSVPEDSFVALQIESATVSAGPAGLSDLGDQLHDVNEDTVLAELRLVQTKYGTETLRWESPRSVFMESNVAGTSLSFQDEATLTPTDQSLAMRFSGNPPSFEEQTAHLRFDFSPPLAIPTFGLAHPSDVAEVDGSAEVVDVHWLLTTFSSAEALTTSPLPRDAGAARVGLATGLELELSALSNPEAPRLRCGPCEVSLGTEQLRVSAAVLTGSIRLQFLDKSSVLTGGGDMTTTFTLVNNSTGEELIMNTFITATMTKPLDINGDPVTFRSPGRLELSQSIDPTTSASDVFVGVEGMVLTPGFLPNSTVLPTYALQNLLVQCGEVTEFRLQGSLGQAGATTNLATNGSVEIKIPIQRAMPFLPDPYATNITDFPFEVLSEAPNLGNLVVATSWGPDSPATVSISLPDLGLASASTLPATEITRGDEPGISDRLLTLDKEIFRSGPHPPALLDLSTNSSQLGIEFLHGSTAPAVSDALMELPTSDVAVSALPPLSWEPVFTPDPEPSFPAVFTSPNDGPPVRIATTTMRMAPLAPVMTLGSIKQGYDTETFPDIAARFTLPFGLIAYAELRKRLAVTSPGGSSLPLFRPSPSLSFEEPAWSELDFKGMRQLSIRAPSTFIGLGTSPISDDTSSHIPGSTINLKFNTDASSAPLSILGAVSADLNSEFGPRDINTARHGPLIPATRVDISGFGASLNSHWYDYKESAPATQRVDIEAYVGRSERVVFEQAFELIHCAARPVRTVTMQRLNTGLITRKVTYSNGSNGLYTFANTAIQTNPGLVRGYYNVRNIRELPNAKVVVSGFEFALVAYDADVELVTDDGLSRYPVRDHRGFLSLTKAGPPLGPDQYAELLRQHGDGVGGSLDITFTLNNRTLKASQISVGPSFNSATGQWEFVVALLQVDVTHGQSGWSWLQYQNGQTPNIVGSAGVPLIRQGLASDTLVNMSPLRFADPQDLWKHPPTTEYALMQAGPSHRVLFPRPKIESDGRDEITSNLVPLIADPYALATALGPFPALELCIPFEDTLDSARPSYRLVIGLGGVLRLDFRQTFPAPVRDDRRVLLSTPDVLTFVDTSDTEVTLRIDDTAPVPWHLGMTRVALVVETADGGVRRELQRVVGDLTCSPTAPTRFDNAELKFGDALGPLKSVMSFMQTLGVMPPVELSMTNDWSCWFWMQCDLDELLKHYDNLAPGATVTSEVGKFIEAFVPELTFSYEASTKMTAVKQKFEARVIVRVPGAILGILDLLLTAMFSMTTAVATTTSTRRTLEGGVGGGVGFSKGVPGLGSFEAYALMTFSYISSEGTGSWAVAASLLLKGELSIAGGFFSVSLSAEMKGILMAVQCRRPIGDPNGEVQKVTQWGVFQATLAVELHVAFIIDIGVEVSFQVESKLNDGDCDWEEFGEV